MLVIGHKKIAMLLFFSLGIYFLTSSCGDTTGPNHQSERILYIRSSKGLYEICTMNPDGTDIRIIASHDTRGEFYRHGFYEARWSPDKNQIAIVGGPNNQLEYTPIWMMDTYGNFKYRVTHDGAGIEWSARGDEILFGQRKYGSSLLIDFYIINVNTLKVKLVMESDSTYWGMDDWSRDSKYVLTSEKTDNHLDREIVIYNLLENSRFYLTDNEYPIHDFNPRWSPDESQIAYISGTHQFGYMMMLMNSDGSDKDILVDTLASYGRPVWSPMGDRIIFSKTEKLIDWYEYAKGSDLFMLDLNSSEVIQITNSASDSVEHHVYDWD